MKDIEKYGVDKGRIMESIMGAKGTNEAKCNLLVPSNGITRSSPSSNITAIVDKIKEHTKKLDSEFDHCLLSMDDSWASVPFTDRIYLDNNWWNVRTILHHFAQQLNNSMMENPYPIYPSNPFNRSCLIPDDIMKLKAKVIELGIPVNIALKVLFQQSITSVSTFWQEADKSEEQFSTSLLLVLGNSLRYRIINSKNSQDSYIGFWVFRKVPLTQFEKMYNHWVSTPYQSYNAFYNIIVDNPEKEYLKHIMDYMPVEEWGSLTDRTGELL